MGMAVVTEVCLRGVALRRVPTMPQRCCSLPISLLGTLNELGLFYEFGLKISSALC